MIQDDSDQIKSVWSEPAREIQKKDIHMLKSFRAPPKVVKDLGNAIMIIFSSSLKKDSYQEFNKMLSNPISFLDKCVNFNVNEFDKSKL